MASKRENWWGVVLAGGEGTRLQKFVKTMYGVVRPKQFCAIVGSRSMLRHTLDRIRHLIHPHRIVTLVNRSHVDFARQQLGDQSPASVLVQPCGRETTAGILYPLLHIYHRNPDAVVAIFPSDHFILEEDKFIEYADRGMHFAAAHPGSIVLLGIAPSRVEGDYGWIEKDHAIANPWNLQAHRIRKFWEKPSASLAESLYQKGCLWNTFIMMGTAATFLTQFQTHVPGMFQQLNSVMRLPDLAARESVLNNIYPAFPSLNYSKSILERNTSHVNVVELTDVYWSDWGDERRIMLDVERLNLRLYRSTPSLPVSVDITSIGPVDVHQQPGERARADLINDALQI